MKKVAILQSNYIPWKGYFDLINSVDEFVFYDEVQFTKNDWRNRNQIKTPQGLQWLSIPVFHKHLHQNIDEILVADQKWRKKHWKTIEQNYRGAEYFEQYSPIFEKLYGDTSETLLCKINYAFIFEINKILGIQTKISWSTDYETLPGKTERLVGICKNLNGEEYISGPAAKDYINEELFLENNIKLSWIDYGGYPEYKQLHSPFFHDVSIIDLILNEGPNSKQFIKSFQN